MTINKDAATLDKSHFHFNAVMLTLLPHGIFYVYSGAVL